MKQENPRRRQNLKRMLRPRHACIVGGQALADSIGRCAEAGFPGEVWVVNPKYTELGGRKCYSSIAALPEAPDVTYVAVPRDATVEILGQLSARGAGGAVCYAAGFGEVGGEGIELQQRLIEAAGDLALVGPNCYGLLNYLDGLALWPTGHLGHRVERGCALIAQSGNIALNLTRNDRSVPFAYVVSSGNQVILDVADFIDVLTDDPAIAAIGLYIEGIADIPAFSRAALKALRAGKPLVALKAGNSELGRKLAMSHTASLAGSARLYDSLFDRLGVIRVESIPALLETTKLLSTAGRPRGNRLVAFTCSGGDGLLTADLCARLGIALTPFSREQESDLRAQLPNFATVSNPLDYNTSLWGHEEKLTRCFTTALSGACDTGMLVIDYATEGPISEQACDASVRALLAACRATGKLALATATIPELLPGRVRDLVIAGGGAPMQGLEDALQALAGSDRFARRKAEVTGVPEAHLLLPEMRKLGLGRKTLAEGEAKKLLAGYGLSVPQGVIVAPEAAIQAAEEIGYPVVLKVAEPFIAHKTEAGAVAVNLKNAGEVNAALARMKASMATNAPGAPIASVLVERMVENVVAELIIGVKRDLQFGLALVLGAGGMLVELVEDSALLLLPIGRPEIERALDRLKIAKLLKGYRNRPAADHAAIGQAVMAVAAFAEAHRENLVELDVNPLMALKDGAIAVDALVVLAE